MSGQRNGPSDEGMLRLAIKHEMDVQRSAAPGMLKLWNSPPQEIRLKEVVAIIRPQRWSYTKLRVQRLRLQAFTHARVLGRGRERGLRYLPRKGAASGMGVRYLPKRMISWIVEETQVEPLIRAIIEANQTGQVGDGKIFVLPIEQAVRIRTEDRGYDALRSERPFEIAVGKPCQSVVPEVAHA
jgi:nitrogen regulatory protein PII 2